MSLVKNLSKDTIEAIAPAVLPTIKDLTKEKNLKKTIEAETEIAGVKELAFMMKSLELRDICDNYLEVEYKEGANKNNKMMLTKRFMESFEGTSIKTWFKECDDRETLVSICKAMGFKVTSKTSIGELQTAAIEETKMYGQQIVLNRLSVPDLQAICDDLGLDGQDSTTSRKILVEAIVTRTDIPERERKPKAIIRKKAIHKATQKEELARYYKASDLVAWCEKNGLKTSGTKKVVIARILAYNAGDKENTMAANTPKRGRKAKQTVQESSEEDMEESEEEPAPKKTKGKKNAKKVVEEPSEEASDEEEEEEAPKPVKSKKNAKKVVEEPSEEASDEEEEEAPKPAKNKSKKNAKKIVEESDEEMEEEPAKEASENEAEEPFDEEAEQKAIAAERKLRETENDEDDEELDISMSDSASQYPKDINGVVFAVHGSFETKSKADLVKIIEENGGSVSAKLTKKVKVFLCTKESKVAQAKKAGIFTAGEEYLSNFF